MFSGMGYGRAYDGQVFALDLKTLNASQLSPPNMAALPACGAFGSPMANGTGVTRAVYDPESDMVLFGALMTAVEDGFRRTPAYDCAGNRWVGLKLKYEGGGRDGKGAPATPRYYDSGMVFDPKRKLIWGVDARCNVYVLKLEAKTADAAELKSP